MKGYKVFNPDFSCRGFQFEVGKSYKHNGPIEICRSGFHFCRDVADCFNYYPFDSNNKVAEIEAVGLVESNGDKSVTDEVVIVREIPWAEMLELANHGNGNSGIKNTGDWNTGNRNTGNRNTGDCNTGNWNTGDCNTGNWNTGNRNTGDRNTGNWNTGNRNTGDCNTGNRNTGNWNTGNCNTGDWNTGNRNTGDWNTGDWNAGNRNTGYFSTITPKLTLFEKSTDMTADEISKIPGVEVLNWNYENNWWIYSENMTNEEKTAHPEHETLGGYLKSIPFKDACALMWANLTEKEKELVKAIPNFDPDIFYRITGIKTEEQT